jgi:hypothetical protein
MNYCIAAKRQAKEVELDHVAQKPPAKSKMDDG